MKIRIIYQASVGQSLELVCSVFPSSGEKFCDEYVQKYKNYLINLLSNGVLPKQLCEYVGVCTGSELLENRVTNVRMFTIINFMG